jgi:membrane protein DedA with SNARE-associated domain
VSAAYLLTPYLAGDLYLFTTHITRNKIIAAVVVAIVAVVAVVVWFIRRRQNRAGV